MTLSQKIAHFVVEMLYLTAYLRTIAISLLPEQKRCLEGMSEGSITKRHPQKGIHSTLKMYSFFSIPC